MGEIIKLNELKNKTSGIYKLNFSNGKIYIGLSNNIKRRMYEHNNSNRLQTHPNHPCDLAIAKYGRFEEIEILEYISEIEYDLLREREKYWIQFYQSNNKEIGYNITPGGEVLYGEDSPNASFSNEEVLDIRKRRFQGERKKDVYKDYLDKAFGTFEKVWLGRGYSHIGQEFIIPPHEISRQEYSSLANRGENNNKAKLKKEDVLQIRKLYEEGTSCIDIQKIFNQVNINSIRRVCKKETWKNI